ncbi:MAG: sigma-70 family RNA polymerase sigma factor, partial [Porticoccaceae bacterium]|nr:sigma-70 family RNA polymerase sigma factor [Porticoccaceae bacterium]
MNKVGAYAMYPEGNPDELVNQFLYLVKRIAHHMIARLPAHIEVDDLTQVGLIGLLDAAKNYNPTLGASFETYATLRIRGSMIDDLRRNDWVPRTVQLKIRQLSEATQEIEAILQRAATDAEIA